MRSDLAPKIGMARGIHDVQARLAPIHRRTFGENGNAALTLEIVGIQRAFDNLLVGVKSAGLAQHLIDQRRLAVIDVRDDCDIAHRLMHWVCHEHKLIRTAKRLRSGTGSPAHRTPLQARVISRTAQDRKHDTRFALIKIEEFGSPEHRVCSGKLRNNRLDCRLLVSPAGDRTESRSG